MHQDISTFRLVEVNSKKLAGEFLLLPVRLYKNDPNYIRPLDKDVEDVFNPSKNKFFRNGECCRWLLYDSNGTAVGRVAAFIDHSSAKRNDQPTGGLGFFECIDLPAAANLLFDTCKRWLQQRGMEAMDGPVNFGDRDRWWGLLVDGFSQPSYCVNYNFPYYRALFENYGFKNYFEQYTYYSPITTSGLSDEIHAKAERIFKNEHYRFVHIDRKQLTRFAEDFRTIYNKAWTKHAGVKEISRAHAMALLNSVKPIMDEQLIWFAYFDDTPIAFFIMIPDINPIIRKLNGRFNLLAKLRFLWYRQRKICRRAFGIIFGVIPEFQARGVEGALVMSFAAIVDKPGFVYTELEMNWIGDFNPSMMKVAEQVGGKIFKTHITYRYLFDREKEFKRTWRL